MEVEKFIMRKLISVVLILASGLSLSSCGSSATKNLGKATTINTQFVVPHCQGNLNTSSNCYNSDLYIYGGDVVEVSQFLPGGCIRNGKDILAWGTFQTGTLPNFYLHQGYGMLLEAYSSPDGVTPGHDSPYASPNSNEVMIGTNSEIPYILNERNINTGKWIVKATFPTINESYVHWNGACYIHVDRYSTGTPGGAPN